MVNTVSYLTGEKFCITGKEKYSEMESVNNFLDNLKKDRECRRCELLEKEKLRKEETEKITQTLNQLADERKKYTLIIDKNLNSITSSKHSIHKSLQETKDDIALPISNASRTHALNFFNDSMTFINNQTANPTKIGEDSGIKTEELLSKIQTSTENSQKDLVTMKNKVAAVETVIANIPILSTYTSSVNEEEESQLETSITDFMSKLN